MEFTNDIKFDNNPTAEKDTKVTYSGSLFKNGANNVNIVYGFSENWNNTSSKPMEKEENGFVANVAIENFDTFNFCFSDENNNWDNNNGFNYISPILPPILEEQENEQVDEQINEQLDEQVDFGTDYASSIDDIIDDILGNTTKQNIVDSKDNDSVDKILESINGDTLPEIEALFNDLFFESVKEDENSNTAIPEISLDPSLAEELKEVGKAVEGVQSSEEDSDILNQINELFAPLLDKNEVTEKVQDDYNDSEELVKQFNDLFETSNEPIQFTNTDASEEQNAPAEVAEVETVSEPSLFDELDSSLNKSDVVKEEKLDVASFNLDNLVSNILEPVVNASTTKKSEESSLFEDVKSHEDDRETSLALINSGNFVVSSRRPSYFYKLRKRIKLAFLKLGKLKDNLIKQLGM